MPRKKRNLSPLGAYHIYARSNNRKSFEIKPEALWTIFENYLFFIHHAYQCRIHSFVMMGNHFHLIASFPNNNISAAFNYFMRETSRAINNQRKSINHVYGGRYCSSLILHPKHYAQVFKYVYQNPLRAGIVDFAEDYPYSSLRGLLGKEHIAFPVQNSLNGIDHFLPDQLNDYTKEINTLPDEKITEAIRQALRKREFKSPKEKSSRKPIL